MKSLWQHLIGQKQNAKIIYLNPVKSVSSLTSKSEKKKKKRGKKSGKGVVELPDELWISVFKFLSVPELVKSVAITSRKFALLWVQAVSKVEVTGKLRKLKEDAFIRVVRKFVRLESLDVCNTGSSEDFQITDKGLLQLAHKFIYSNADFIARKTTFNDQLLEGEYDFSFNYEQHLDSLDSITEDEAGSTIDEDDNCSGTSFGNNANDRISPILPALCISNTLLASVDDDSDNVNTNLLLMKNSTIMGNKEGFVKEGEDVHDGSIPVMRNIFSENAMQSPENFIAKKRIRTPKARFNYAHIYYYYPPPKPQDSLLWRYQDAQGGPLYGLHTLTSMNLLGCHYITENGVKYLTFFCQNMKHLFLKGCTKVNDNALSHIAQFERLESLDLTGCTHITNAGLQQLARIQSKSLSFLDLTFCHKITDDGLHYLSAIKSLIDVNLQCCSKLTAKGVAHLFSSCKQLKTLNLTGCSLVTLCSITGLGTNSVPMLQKINMMGCKLTCDECLRKLLSWTPNLTEVILAYSESISDIGIENFIEGSKHLSHLNLKRCIQITDKTLEVISTYLKDTITQLNLTGCRGFTNKGLGCLTALHHLKSLALRKCQQINNIGLQYLTLNVALETLDLSENNQIEEHGVLMLCSSLSAIAMRKDSVGNLKQLLLKKCQKISKEFKAQLQETYPKTVIG